MSTLSKAAGRMAMIRKHLTLLGRLRVGQQAADVAKTDLLTWIEGAYAGMTSVPTAKNYAAIPYEGFAGLQDPRVDDDEDEAEDDGFTA